MAKGLTYLDLEAHQVVPVDEPAWKDVKAILQNIGDGIGVCHLNISRGILTIGDTKNPQRVVVTYKDYLGNSRGPLPDDYRRGWLLDVKYANSKARVHRDIEGMRETERFYRTVSKDLALNVAEHFWNTEIFPDGLDWDGTMGRLGANP